MHHRSHYALIVLLLVGGLWQQVPRATAAPPPDERAKLRSAESLAKKASHLYAAKKYDEAATAAREAQETLGELEKSDNKVLAQPLAALRKSLSKTHDQLKHENFELPDLPPAVLSAKAGKKPSGGAADKISFTKQIAPVLVARCGGCHVQRARGELSMASYAQLLKGGKDGVVVVQPGRGKGSRLYEVIESGDMPRGGGLVLPEELALLVRWIDEGAIFDGKDPSQRIDGDASPPPAAPMVAKTPQPKAAPVKTAAAEKPRAGSKGASEAPAAEVLFARDIAPVLAEHCVGCHGDRNPRGRLNLDSFAGLMKGGETGSSIAAGNPSGSLLIEKLHGTAEGKRMPADKPPLPSETIAKFEQWIAAGAKFDGIDTGMSLARLVAVVRAQAATHEQLSRDRAALTEKNWRLILPDAHADHTETEHFLVFGNVSTEDLAAIGQQAEALVPKLEKMLKVPTGEPLIKGRLTIYVFQKHYDYDEIGQMLEHREIPPESHGHWHYDVVDAYAAVVPAKNNEYTLDTLLAEQIAAVYVASQGNVPHWFADGSGRAIAAKINPKDSRVRQWDTRLLGALDKSGRPSDLLDGKLNQSDADAVSFGFGRYLMSNPGRYYGVISSLRAGAKFDDAFARAYNGPPKQIIEGWAQHGGKRGH